jgi:hypothetical protein
MYVGTIGLSRETMVVVVIRVVIDAFVTFTLCKMATMGSPAS